MSIEKRLERVEAILDARGLDWDHPRVASDHFADANKMVADEPPKKWRIREPGEMVREGDLTNAKSNPPSEPPDGDGWIDASICVGSEVAASDECVFACPVADEPAKEPEHPAGPMPDPGEGYRILSKNPPEQLTLGDEHELSKGEWVESVNARTHRKQGSRIWYRRKIGFLAKEPVDHFAGPRISPGEWLDIRDAYRDVTPADVGRLVYVRNGELEPWIELRLAEVTGADFPYRCTKDGLDPTMWQAFRYACIRNEKPAKEAQPSWEPKVGDWVRVTRPVDWKEWKDPLWREEMHQYDGKILRVALPNCGWHGNQVKLEGVDWFFHCSWLSPPKPAEPPKAPQPEYREPVLPADLGKWAEFSHDGINWMRYKLRGCHKESEASLTIWSEKNIGFRHCRIKKDA